jgi:hypothetical protein
MYFKIILLGQALLAFADEKLPSFPPDPCTVQWSERKPEDYLYDYRNDSSYEGYQKRMAQHQLDRRQCHKAWTVLIFMSPEDLLPYAYLDLLEMETKTAGSSIRSDIVVELNPGAQAQTRRFHMFQKSETATEKDILSPVVMQISEPKGATSDYRLLNFLKWGIEHYPSENYLVVIWGHGGGWTAIETPPNPRHSPGDELVIAERSGGLALSKSLGNISLPGLREILKTIKNWRGDPIEVFASDACLMQTIEDSAELAEHASYICGSEDIESYAGFPYQTLLNQLNSGEFDGAPKQTPNGIVSNPESFLVSWMIPQLYKESFDPEKGSQKDLDPKAYYHLTGCSISSKHLRSSLIPHLNRLAIALNRYLDEIPSLNAERWLILRSVIDQGPFFLGGTQDLGQFLKNLYQTLSEEAKKNKTLSPALHEILEALKKTYNSLNYTIVNVVLGENYPKFNPDREMGPRGLSIWLPRTDQEFQDRIADFSKSLFYGAQANRCSAPAWKEWIKRMYVN